MKMLLPLSGAMAVQGTSETTDLFRCCAICESRWGWHEGRVLSRISNGSGLLKKASSM
jgi:hypothetical protein